MGLLPIGVAKEFKSQVWMACINEIWRQLQVAGDTNLSALCEIAGVPHSKAQGPLVIVGLFVVGWDVARTSSVASVAADTIFNVELITLELFR